MAIMAMTTSNSMSVNALHWSPRFISSERYQKSIAMARELSYTIWRIVPAVVSVTGIAFFTATPENSRRNDSHSSEEGPSLPGGTGRKSRLISSIYQPGGMRERKHFGGCGDADCESCRPSTPRPFPRHMKLFVVLTFRLRHILWPNWFGEKRTHGGI